MNSRSDQEALEGCSMTRRALMLAMGTATLSLAFPGFCRTASANGPLTRQVPASGEKLPVIGLGTSRVFEVGESEQERVALRAVVEQLASVENSVLDTSPMYGEAESVAGELMEAARARGRLFVATKVWTTGRQAGVAQMERSLRRLRSDRLDLIQVHNLQDWRTHLGTLRDWKAQGRVRYLGVTHYHEGAHAALERVMRDETLDFVQLNYSLAEPEAMERLLPLALDRGIAVIANRPFARGRLFRAVRGEQLPGWAAELGCDSWAQFFLKFVIAHPAVTCTIPGTSKLKHMVDNQGAGHLPLPDAAIQRRMLDLLRRI